MESLLATRAMGSAIVESEPKRNARNAASKYSRTPNQALLRA